MKKKEFFLLRAIKGIGYNILSEIMCLIICTMLLHFIKMSVILKIIVGLFTLLITLGLFFNWAYYSSKHDKDMVKFHDMKQDNFMHIKMALIGPLLSYIMLIALYLMKAGIIGDHFNFYLLFNMWLTPFVDMFTDSRLISDINAWGIIGITLLILLQPTAIIITYILTYNEVDIYKFIFVKKDSKK